MKVQYQILLTFVLINSLGANSIFSKNEKSPPTYNEKYRPGYHFTPPSNWLNDPNGLIYYGGMYHLYYQYNYLSNDWNHMNWGHAVSTDLVHWKNLPIAIAEYDGIQIYSGCNIIDVNNTSGFCKTKEFGCLLAFYTAHSSKGEAQAFAYSNNLGVSYTQYAHNPIIDEGMKDHRDPKVIWYAPESKWVMITALPTIFKCRLYSSTDLINWTHLSDFGPEGSTDGVWEDPDLFALPDDEGNLKWILVHSVNVTKVEYYIGDFDGTTFTTTESKGTNLYFDYGRDFTEAATFNSDPKGRRLMTAWFNEAMYAQSVPTDAWKGALNLIRELKLRRYPEGLRIVSEPVQEYSNLRSGNKHYENIELNQKQNNFTIPNPSSQFEILATFTLPNDTSKLPSEFGFKVFAGQNQSTTIGYKVKEQVLFTDRAKSGSENFNHNFLCVTNADLAPESNTIQLRIFLDQSTVEVFANNGKVAMSNLVFPDPSQNQIYAYSVDGEVSLSSLDTWILDSIWGSSSHVEGENESKNFLSQILSTSV